MIEILDFADENIFGLRISGGFTTEDVEQVFERLLEKIRGQAKFKIYYEVVDFEFGDVSRDIVESEFKYLLHHPEILANMEKAALITDLDWLRRIAAVEFALIPTLSGKTFFFSERDVALFWLRSDERAAQKVNVIYPELVELGTIKALGGFALGLLMSNYISRPERKKIGAAALVGSIVLGIPFAVKFFNNNRKLLNK